jgi:hypothetical protein
MLVDCCQAYRVVPRLFLLINAPEPPGKVTLFAPPFATVSEVKRFIVDERYGALELTVQLSARVLLNLLANAHQKTTRHRISPYRCTKPQIA